MSDYTIKVEPDKERVLFHGVTFGYGVGSELPLWLYRAHSGIVVVKKVGSHEWAARGQSGYYPAEFMVLRITGPREGMDGWQRAEGIISFPIRKPIREGR